MVTSSYVLVYNAATRRSQFEQEQLNNIRARIASLENTTTLEAGNLERLAQTKETTQAEIDEMEQAIATLQE